MRHALGLALLLSLSPALAAAQGADTAQGALKLPATDSAKRLPADRSSDLLSWLPGGSFDIDGRAAWHGRTAEGLDRSVDGILWNSLVRSSGGLGLGATVRRLEPAFNAIGSAWLRTGAYGADQNVGGVGALGYVTRSGGDRWSVTGTAESEEPFRADGGQGVSRFEAAGGGPIGAGWRVRAAALLTGRRFAPTGVDYGATPYLVPTGTDTTYGWEVAPGDTNYYSAQTFGGTSSVPYSPRSTSDLAARVDGRIANVSVWARYLFGGDGERLFSYENVSNTGQTFARNGTTQDLAAGASIPLGAFRLDAALGWQDEHGEEGPINAGEDAQSRDPALGVMLGGVPLRFTMENFPVDDELIWNYRLNRPGSRRSPYDLENTAQYALLDQFRNNAYGLLGFTESGGPVGVLRLYRDRRWALSAAVHHPLGGGDLAVGGELRRHDIQYYAHQLTSQAFSDVWAETPAEQALFANWATRGSSWKLTAGVRMDRFATGARRPRMFPRISSAQFLTYLDPVSGDTLRWSYADAGGDSASYYAKNTDEDDAHVAFAPRVAIEGILADDWSGHLSFGRLARTPDLAILMSGLNTDYAITNDASVWATDYGHEITDLIEGGVRYGDADRWFDLTLFRETNVAAPVIRATDVFDPLSLTNRLLRQATMERGPIYTGLTLAGRIPATEWLRLAGSYSYISSDHDDALYVQENEMVRPSTFVLAAELTPAPAGALGGFGGVVSWRQASGLARVVDPGFGPLPASNVRDENLPSWRSLDLRVTKAFPLGASAVTVYLDARNLLDFENLTRAFLDGDPTSHAGGENYRWQSDSSEFAQEALASGAYSGGTIDLAFGGASDPRASCGGWRSSDGDLNPPNCAYLLQAEAAFGDGDHLFTVAEQRRASNAYWRTQNSATRFSAPGRSLRIGAQIGF
jgi:hypothetical protein